MEVSFRGLLVFVLFEKRERALCSLTGPPFSLPPSSTTEKFHKGDLSAEVSMSNARFTTRAASSLLPTVPELNTDPAALRRTQESSQFFRAHLSRSISGQRCTDHRRISDIRSHSPLSLDARISVRARSLGLSQSISPLSSSNACISSCLSVFRIVSSRCR